LRTATLIFASLGLAGIAGAQSAALDRYEEPYRPQYHFSPEKGWIGDPDGLIHYNGSFSLFWWGKATSTDLVHYTQESSLVMTGDEILDAGVQVMAQPPGKKNSSIHLLSGGEKALTAIALVFAIFQLNPAPFCLLDEVDAPLDDANTERYSKLVKTMSAGTQFLFISHNKIAMEMAEQLIGVTMQEQGVSRIVAVDMQAAVSLAQAA